MASKTEELFEQMKWVQHDLFNKRIPVLLLIEGGGSKMMGRVIGDVINILEPRGIEHHRFAPRSGQEEKRRPIDYLKATPAAGRFGIFDRGWYSQFFEDIPDKEHIKKTGIRNINALERFITDNGTLFVKIYLNSDGDLDKALGSKHDDCGRISRAGPFVRHDIYKEPVSEIMKETNTKNAPWDIIEVEDREQTVIEITRILINRLTETRTPDPVTDKETEYPNERKNNDLASNTENDNAEKLKEISSELADIQCKLAKTERSLVLVFEGWDAAGKGSAIKRVSNALNPRGYNAVPIGVPSDFEKSHNYLWRFCVKVPEDGMITIFDRSWYGRMMVEPIEGFCTPEEYERSHREINMFETMLRDAGSIVIKFWMEIDRDEQLKRFKEREEDPMKNWKITDDDWRNRSKWDEYEIYVNRMISLTNTPDAPWIVIPSNDKKYARVKVLKTIVDALKKELKD